MRNAFSSTTTQAISGKGLNALRSEASAAQSIMGPHLLPAARFAMDDGLRNGSPFFENLELLNLRYRNSDPNGESQHISTALAVQLCPEDTMLLSQRNRFLFVHIPKNAGTSITAALLPHTANRWERAANRFLRRFGILQLAVQPFGSHVRASTMVEKLGRKSFDWYYSFAVVRNPWDRQVSLYTYTLK